MIYLRELERTDLKRITQWRRDPDLVQNFGEPFRFIGSEIDTTWFDSYLENRHRQVRLAICLEDSDQHIGNIYLLNIHAVYRSAEISLFIAPKKYRGMGIGKMACQRMIAHAFNDLNLNRLGLTLLSENAKALSLYCSLGFEQEGLLREAVCQAGAYLDLVQMGLLRSEWKSEE